MNEPLSLDTLAEKVRGLELDDIRLERDTRNLRELLELTATKQGDRIGNVEKEFIRLRTEFKFAMVIAAGLWAVVQGAALVTLSSWLAQARAKDIAEVRQEVEELQETLNAIGLQSAPEKRR